MKKIIKIGNKIVGEGHPVFIIAEAGVNHNGRLDLAKKLIDVAAKAGVDAVKFQTFNPAKLIIRGVPQAQYQKKNMGNLKDQYQMLDKLKLAREFHPKLKRYSESRGLIFLSTPFSMDDAEFLHQLGLPAFKVGSSDTNNLPYLKKIAKYGKPIILSTGMSDMEEVKLSARTIKSAGNKNIIILQCTTNYPTPFNEANLRVIETIRNELGYLTGYSDHTLGIEVPIAAVALGAVIIEKHFTLDREMSGPDHKTSLEPSELCKMVSSIRNIEKALGSGKKEPFKSELKIAKVAKKSIVAKVMIKRGQIIKEEMLDYKRPGTGISPMLSNKVIGMEAKKDFAPDELLKFKFLKDVNRLK
jgi:N-acetylneuraminate synthase